MLGRLPTALAFLVASATLLVIGASSGAGAGPPPPEPGSPSAGVVDVIQVDGLLDPVLVDFVERSVDRAAREEARWVVLQTDSGGAVVSDERLVTLVERLQATDVAIAVWVGPSGSQLTGRASWLLLAADEVGMAPGTRVGGSGPVPEALVDTPAVDRLPGDFTDRRYSDSAAADAGITTVDAPIIGQLVVELPDVETREVVQDDGQVGLEPVTQVRFSQLPLVDQLMHSVASPAVAYLLLAVGLGLIVFELFTAGVGVAGVIGAGSLVLACYGLAVLPIRWWGLALLVVSFLAFAVDVQTGVPRFWTGVGFVAFVAGSLALYDGLSLSWITLGVAVIGVALSFLAGMPSMVRTRFSTPTIGREWMIGEMGRAVTDLRPDGVVQIREAMWRAYTNRATPIEELDRVRVVGIEGLVLEVEPEEGAARDYREPRRRPTEDG